MKPQKRIIMKKLMFILLLVLTATACSKSKKIERNLWNHGGEWEIKSVEEFLETTEPNKYNYSDVIQNGGTIQFNKDGTGKFNFSSNLADIIEDYFYEEYVYNEFSYHHTENSIFFIYEDIDGFVCGLEWEKDKMVMILSETHNNTYYDENNNPIPYQEVYGVKFNCEKNR